VTDLRPKVKLMHLLRMRRHYCYVWHRQHWTYFEFAWTLSCFSLKLPSIMRSHQLASKVQGIFTYLQHFLWLLDFYYDRLISQLAVFKFQLSTLDWFWSI